MQDFFWGFIFIANDGSGSDGMIMECRFDLGIVTVSFWYSASETTSWNAIPGVIWVDPPPTLVSAFLSKLPHQNMVGTSE